MLQSVVPLKFDLVFGKRVGLARSPDKLSVSHVLTSPEQDGLEDLELPVLPLPALKFNASYQHERLLRWSTI